MTTTPTVNPLQLGEVLYEILDATVIATPQGGDAPHYNRVTFTTAGGQTVDTAPLASSSPILDACASPDPLTGTTPVFLLSADSVSMIGAAGAASMLRWPVTTAGCTAIVGIDPMQAQQRTLLLLGQDGAGPFLLPLTCMDVQETSTAIRLDTVARNVQAGVLARQQLSAHVIVASIESSSLLVYDLGSSVLGADPTAPATAPPQVVLGTTGGGPVAMTTGSFLAGADQQVAVAFTGGSGELEVRVLGWNAQGELSIIGTWSSSSAPAPASGPPLSQLAVESPTVRLTAGDLVAAGTDQLILGFPATFQGTAGCAALLLFEMSGTGLRLSSSTAVATGDQPPQPIASIDLRLAAGLFGDILASDAAGGSPSGVLGVMVIGCGASAQDLFEQRAVVTAGLVPVSANTHSFPSVADAPGTPDFLTQVVTVGNDTTSIIAFPSDVTGQSVILGPPSFSQTEGQTGQVLAIVQVPPYEASTASTLPSLTVSKTTSQVTGCNVSSNKVWTFSDDTGTSIGIGPLTLGTTLASSYGNGFSNVTDNSTTSTAQITSTISEDDLMFLYEMAYDIWVYPIYRKSVQDAPDGTVAVIFPQTPQPLQTIIAASNPGIGYKPASQVGTLLSYVDAPMDGYNGQNLLFQPVGVNVDDDKVGTTVTYDQTKMETQNIGVDYSVQNSAGDSAHFSASTTLFDYVPVTFGLNMSNGSSYSDSNITTTTMSYTTALTITFASGAVTDIEYEYEVYPYIYQHATMGCLVVTYDVTLAGPGWAAYYANKPSQVMLIALMPNSSNPFWAAFSRDISFTDLPDGTVDVTVSLFNNSQQTAEDVTCELYLGVPVVSRESGHVSLQPPSATPAATRTLPSVDGAGQGAERAKVTFNTTLAQNSEVTVRVYAHNLEPLARTYWGIYPPSAFTGYAATAGLV